MIHWNLERADKEFSLFVRKRDGRCMNPMCHNGLYRGADPAQLENSHFWPRGDLIARFDPENCIALCHGCHSAWENTKQGKYRDLMIQWLGLRRYNALEKRVEDYKFKNQPQLKLDTEIKKIREFLQNEKV